MKHTIEDVRLTIDPEFRDIKGFEGKYQVSDTGEVRSIDHYIEQISSFGRKQRRLMRGRTLKQNKTWNGYMIVYLSIGKKYQWFTVHRLVAETFIPNPQNLSDVNHINGNKLDNRMVNLEWCTRSYNVKHSYDVLRRKRKCWEIRCKETGELIKGKCVLSKITKKPISYINKHINENVFFHNGRHYQFIKVNLL